MDENEEPQTSPTHFDEDSADEAVRSELADELLPADYVHTPQLALPRLVGAPSTPRDRSRSRSRRSAHSGPRFASPPSVEGRGFGAGAAPAPSGEVGWAPAPSGEVCWAVPLSGERGNYNVYRTNTQLQHGLQSNSASNSQASSSLIDLVDELVRSAQERTTNASPPLWLDDLVGARLPVSTRPLQRSPYQISDLIATVQPFWRATPVVSPFSVLATRRFYQGETPWRGRQFLRPSSLLHARR